MNALRVQLRKLDAFRIVRNVNQSVSMPATLAKKVATLLINLGFSFREVAFRLAVTAYQHSGLLRALKNITMEAA